MSATISIKQDDLTTALRGFLLSLVDVEVFLAQENLVPMPNEDFVTMTPMFITGLSTNRVAYNDPGVGAGSEMTQRSNQWRCQLDFYGNTAAEMAAIVGTMIRSEYASNWFKQNNMPVTPLYAGEPHQITSTTAQSKTTSNATSQASSAVTEKVNSSTSEATQSSVSSALTGLKNSVSSAATTVANKVSSVASNITQTTTASINGAATSAINKLSSSVTELVKVIT